MPRTRIKICGITREEDAFAAIEAGADALGFVLAPNSPRTIAPEAAAQIIIALPPFVTTVALFVNPKPAAVEAAMAESPFFDMVQLHGKEPEPAVRTISELGMGIIKAVRADQDDAQAVFAKWARFHEIDAVLLDGGPGGTGQTFDWGAWREAAHDSDQPVLLAGGLTPENVADAITSINPYAVDVSSGVESSAGVKDAAKLADFCSAVRDTD